MSDDCNGSERFMHTKGDGSWWEHDARGIPLCRVCDRCQAAKLARYRPEVLTDSQYEANEEIEPEPSVGGIDDYFDLGGEQ